MHDVFYAETKISL